MTANDPTQPPSSLPDPAKDPDGELTANGSAFPIVGVGASAGGLEALTELLTNLPPHPGMAFLFVLHLEPHHKSRLPEILSRATPMPVQEATEGMEVKEDHVYLIPPNTNIALADGNLALTPRAPGRGQNMPADHLFRSLAAVQREKAIGVILSGGGTDGTLGFQAIKAEGGITFAQQEASARQSSMPRSAVADGNVDYILTPREIARQLVRLNGHPYTRETGTDQALLREAGGAVAEIINLLRSRTAVDFTNYKQSTIRRRVQRRMALRGLEDVRGYLQVLREDPAELQALYQDFLIRVTQFFRDPAAFEALKTKVFPRLVHNRALNATIRLWVAGCATGEEVYSLAMCLLEYLGDGNHSFPVKILATDLSEAALDKARAGVYVDNIEIDVSPERLRRFFVRLDGHYQISKAVRDLCVFSRHNMAADPPFSRLDLVSCRNVLIYMDLALQKRVLPILHYALNPDGFLFLGASENVGAFTDLFETVDAKNRIFTKKAGAYPLPLDFSGAVVTEDLVRRTVREEGGALWSALDVQREADRVVLARYAPVGVVVDETGTVLQFRGRTAAFLEPAPGMASLDLMRMLREGLLAEVRAALHQAKVENKIVTKDRVRVLDGAHVRLVKVEVIPFKAPPAGAHFYLVLFQDVPPPPEASPTGAAPAEARSEVHDQQIAQLQQELAALREYLQSVIEEQESTNEELKSANEEILSANEELQSTNEELQTAKEEAQSANEELATVNEELQHRNTDLARVNNDLVNVLSGVNIAIVMVSRDLIIRRFTPQAERLLNLISTDVGRPLGDIKSNLDVPDLAQLAGQVIDSLTPHESEVQDKEGHLYSLRIRPYVTLENKIAGASIVLLDTDSIRKGLETKEPAAPPKADTPPAKGGAAGSGG
jgi:two-component system CheB/CheR fusion protein